MKKAVMKNLTISVVMICMLLLSSCIWRTPEPPYMVDRSTGWIPCFPIHIETSTYSIYKYNDLDMWARLLNMVDYPPRGSLDKEAVPEAVEDALRSNFGSSYIDMGSKAGVISETYNNAGWIYRGGETLVIFEKLTGKLLICIDTRLQREIVLDKVDEGSIDYNCDLAQLSTDQLISFHAIASGFRDDQKPDKTGYELPLSATDAYNMTARMLTDGVIGGGSTRQGGLGGAFYVYYCEASDAWFIVCNTLIQAISRETGEQLLIVGYSNKIDRDSSVKEPAK